MALDPRTPVIVGVGQVSQPDLPAPEPVALLAAAARLAAEDAGAPGLLAALDSIRVVNVLTRGYPDPAAMVAALLDVTTPARRWPPHRAATPPRTSSIAPPGRSPPDAWTWP